MTPGSTAAAPRPAASPVRLFAGFVRELTRTMRGQTARVLALMLAATAAESVALVMLVPLMATLGLETGDDGMGRLAGLVTGALEGVGLPRTLPVVVGIYAAAVGMQLLFVRWQTVATYALEHTFVARLRTRLYRAIAGSDWSFFIESRASDFTHALTSELQRVGVATYQLTGLAASAVIAALYVGLAFHLSPLLTGLAIVFGLVPLVLVSGRLRRASAAGDRVGAATGELYSAAIEHFAAAKTTKSYGAEERSAYLFEVLARGVARANVDSMRIHVNDRAIVDLAAVGALAALLLFAVEGLALANAEVLMLLFLFARVMPRLTGLHAGLHGLVALLPSYGVVADLESRCAAARPDEPEVVVPPPFVRGVQLEGVTFTYPGRTAPALSDVALGIPAGEMVAIVGSSGAGKSTVADIVLGLLAPATGRVLVDDEVLAAGRMAAWRTRIGYVAQDTFLFHDTVRENMRWASPDATDEEIRQAFRLAAADGFVADLPQGLDTVLGDRGLRLSGGERQRLALARALLRQPRLLILDEATSALDSENERLIRESILGLRGRVTLLVISHRLSTVRDADRVYVLENGRVVESGRWDVLAAAPDSRLAALCRAQGIGVDGSASPASPGRLTRAPEPSKTATGA